MEENTVERIPGQDDAAFEAIPQEEAPDVEPLSQAPESPEAAQQTKSAPGWIKRRIEEGVRRETAALEARLRTEYEQRLTPLREAALAGEADRLVREGEFKTRERAAEYLRLKSGAPAQAAPASDVQLRAQALFAQAKTIQALGGTDVLSLYHSDADVRARVLGGEWDFLDVLRHAQPDRRVNAPAPVRGANGGAQGTPDIRRMSAAQLTTMNEALMRGEVIDLRN